MIALTRMRLSAFVRSGRALPPAIAVLVVLAVIYGGGASTAAVAYGYSAAALFPVLAWLTKVLLDAEPDTQRRLARTAVGPTREASAGLLAALFVALLVTVLTMLVPYPFHAIDTHTDFGRGIALGILAHLLAVPPAIALGALSSRAVTRTVRTGVAVLAVSAVLVVVLGLKGSWAPWLVPPVMATARILNDPLLQTRIALIKLTARAVLWFLVAVALYARLRRARS